MALPVIISVLLVNAGLGMITRSAPALNIISVGFPAIMLSGILIVLIALPGIVQRIDLFWRDGFEVFSRFWGTIMAEDDIKSEEPTPRKLEKTREEGQYARSQDLSVALLTIAVAIVIYLLGEDMGRVFYRSYKIHLFLTPVWLQTLH